MTGQPSSISKKRTKGAGKGGNAKSVNASNLTVMTQELSPISSNSENSKQDGLLEQVAVAGAQGPRRKLDLSKIKLSSLASHDTVDSLGALIRYTREILTQKEGGKVDVCLFVSPIRLPEEWEDFKFFLFADHTGVASFGSPVEVFDLLREKAASSSIPAIKVTGKVYFKWSTKTKGELYLTFRAGSTNVEIAHARSNPQTFSTFHTIRNIIAVPYNKNTTFSRLLGDCVVSETLVEGKKSFMLQDCTVCAGVHVTFQGEEDYNESFDFRDGCKTFEGKFRFEPVLVDPLDTIDGIKAIAATVNASDLVVIDAYGCIERQIMKVKETKMEDYQFKFDDSHYDIRSNH